jgi:hypothetical protein
MPLEGFRSMGGLLHDLASLDHYRYLLQDGHVL